jgi:hypothetical protein
MPWVATFTKDDDKDAGLARATFQEEGSDAVFEFSQRIDGSDEAIAEFAELAKAKYALTQSRAEVELDAVEKLTEQLNS